ncbi:MAG: TonB-dependent receptor plug domain-containing protein, partial [Rhodothermia bacterium]
MYRARVVILTFTVATAVVSAVAPRATFAQALADTTVKLPPVVVEATRNGGSATTPTRLTTIGPADLEALPIRSVADALDRRTSIHVLRYGPNGTATASIRGVGGKHTTVYLDGLLLSDPQSNQIDLALIPVIMLESVEITHGPGSAARGSGSLGGSIALNTLQAEDRPRIRIGLEGGEYGQRRLGAAGATKSGRLAVTFAGEMSQNDGDYPYSNPTLIDPIELVREGADKSSATLFGNAVYSSGKHSVSASTWINSVERGLPGPGNAPPTDARQWDDDVRVWLKSEHRLGSWATDFNAMMHGSKLRYTDPATATDDVTRTTTTEVQGAASRVLGTSWFATAGFKGGIDRSDDISEERLAAFGEAIFESGRLRLFPSVRVETWLTDQDTTPFFVPRVGVNIRLLESDAVHAKANLGRTYRIPSFLERYWTPGGNPDLLPETGWSLDTSVHTQRTGDTQFSKAQAEAGIFYTNLQNQIAWFPSLVGSGVQVWRPFNVGRVVTYGVEVSADTRRRLGVWAIDVGFAATISRALDRSDSSTRSYGKQLRYTPEATGSLFVGLTLESLTLNLSGRHVGQRYVTSDESMNIDAYTVLDAQLGYKITVGPSTGSFAILVENAFNA